MPVFTVKPRFYPIRLIARIRSSSELTLEVKNNSSELVWLECDLTVPETFSLAPDRELRHGRMRAGIMAAGESAECKCKVYGSPFTEPGLHKLKITAYGYGKDGSISAREEKEAEIRCERLKA